jgi:hypothetical protein
MTASAGRSPIFVLLHSPLVGPFTWGAVAEELQRLGLEAVTPALSATGRSGIPYWQWHAQMAAATMGDLPAGNPVLLVAHSGAGMLQPSIGRAYGRPIAGYVFCDAGIPEDGASRLGMMHSEAPELAHRMRSALEAGESLPNWTEEDLAEIVPEGHVRRRLIAELQPQPLAYWDEPVPVFEGWPDAPCAYLQFSPAYNAPAERARSAGWPYRRIDAAHFHMLVDPPAVVSALVGLAAQLGVTTL